MDHAFFDGDIILAEVANAISSAAEIAYVRVGLEYVDEGCEPELHLTFKDLQYLADLTGSKLTEVSGDSMQAVLSRDDIILLAKTAGVTAEELG